MTKFKIEDRVRCIKYNGKGEGTSDVSGSGWEEGKILTITALNTFGRHREDEISVDVIFSKETYYGVFENYLELVNEANMSKFNIEDICKPIHPEKCVEFNKYAREKGAEYIKITAISDNGNYTYDILDENYKRIDSCCYCYGDKDLELVKPKQTKIMNKLTSKIRRFFTPALQKLYKAGLVDDCANLTESGKAELELIVRETHEVELVKVAEAIIKEAKEDK